MAKSRKQKLTGRTSLQVRKKKTCTECNGSGQTMCASGAWFYACGNCNGSGKIIVNPLLPNYED